ncbi:capsular polysaccharide export protein, LipB/KpsS family [Xanthobacter sediminis]
MFVDRDKYYWDPTAKTSVPVADVVLGWGRLQQEIFLERGYPAEHFHVVGAPKFDAYVDYRPSLTREQFCGLYGLRADRKLILFATQPLDSQLDTRIARDSQREAITELLAYAEANECQLMVRLPPSKDDVLGGPLRRQITRSPFGAVDDAQCYLVAPEEAVYHADVVSSVNSTMLFEAVLLGRPALSMKYVEFDQMWEKAGIPAAHNREEMEAILPIMLAGNWSVPPEGMAWAANMFGVGTFDGGASARIGAFLKEAAANDKALTLRPKAIERLFARRAVDVVGVPSIPQLSEERQPHLLALLNARTRVEHEGGTRNLKFIAGVDIFAQWGTDTNHEAHVPLEAARTLGRPVVVLEDGLIGAPGTALILDDTAAYYDAATGSRLERWLAAGPELSAKERARARRAITEIVSQQVTKGSHAAPLTQAIGIEGRRKVLVVDQPTDDPAVLRGLASGASFEQMLQDVVAGHQDCDIILLQHPNPAKAENASYLASDKLSAVGRIDDIHTLPLDTNPYAVLDKVDEVFVVSSHVGFEALMAGKTVHCYGAPFYAGWGLTKDRVPVKRRNRSRTIEDVFHAAYILHSRYYDPRSNGVVELEEAIARAVESRD